MSLELAAVFSDKMVLQRDKEIAIFGQGDNGKEILVSLAGETLDGKPQSTSASVIVENGRFKAFLNPLVAGVDHTLKVSDGETELEFSDIAIGEVWLAGGQSNMEFELKNCTEKDVLNSPASSDIRFYYTQKKAFIDQDFLDSERETHWECFGDEGTKDWSAVGYFFAERLNENLNVPVGIIGCNWGGTSASNWMPRTDVENKENLKVYAENYDKAIAGKSFEQQKNEYEAYALFQQEFDRRAGELYAENPDIEWDRVQEIIGECQYPGPMGVFNPMRLGGLYECMLSRIAPYSIKGVIYYQGESDDNLPDLYEELFSVLINRFRLDFNDKDLPVVFCQLPMHRYRQDPDFKNWCMIRQAQYNVGKKVPKAIMTDIIDQGVWDDIHPKMKRTVGRRMCAMALSQIYGIDKEDAYIPEIEAVTFNGDTAEVTVGNAKEIIYREPETTRRLMYEPAPKEAFGFEVAGEDKKFYFASSVNLSGNRITVKSDQVENPVHIRYLWTNYTDVVLFNESSMPVIPFEL